MRDEELIAWLEAEEADDREAAEALLASLFRRLSAAAPAPGFTERVMRRAGLVAPRARAQAASPPLGRRLAAAALLLLVAGLLLWPGLLSGLAAGLGLSELSLAGLMAGLAEAVSFGSRLLRDALVAWQKASEVAPGLASQIDRPAVAASAVAVLGLGALALRWLAQRVRRDWSFPYASA